MSQNCILNININNYVKRVNGGNTDYCRLSHLDCMTVSQMRCVFSMDLESENKQLLLLLLLLLKHQ